MHGQQRGLGAVGHAELGEQVAHVGLDRLLRDAEFQGDPLVGVAEGDQLKDLALAAGELLDGVGGVAGARPPSDQ